MAAGRTRPGPGRPLIPDGAALAGAAVLLIAHNLGIERLPRWLYVPANLATAGGVLAFGAAAGTPLADLGLSRSGAAAGLTVGGAAGVAAALAVATAACHPAIRPLFADRRMEGAGLVTTAYRAAVRIPLGTVVLEEVAFRGVLVMLLDAAFPRGWAVAGASVAFGLWHLVPTAAALDLNGVATGRRARAVALAGAVVVTAVAGAGLCLLRLATGSLVAPALVHASATSTATVVAGVLQAGGPRWAPLG